MPLNKEKKQTIMEQYKVHEKGYRLSGSSAGYSE